MSQKELTIPEMQKAITEYKASLETIKTTFETYKAETEEKMKKAETEKEEIKKKIEEKGPNNEGKNAKFHKAMKAAMDEKDEKKQAEAMKEAMTHYKAEGDEDEKKDDEKEAMKAEIETLRAEAIKPKLQILTAAYKAVKTDDKTIAAYTAEWKKQTLSQLDAEIDKVKPFMARTITAPKEEKQPLGFSTFQFNASTEDEYSASLKTKTDSELFGGKF